MPPENEEEMRVRLAIAEHLAMCPQVVKIEATAARLRELNGIDRAVKDHKQTLYGEEHGLVARFNKAEVIVTDMKPVVESLKNWRIWMAGVGAAIVFVGGVAVWIGFERVMRMLNAMAATPK